ncbi:hypothetical protein IP91_01987 [Pseudoduganella lurida]|uniref:Uncharacterized protein n=1 Tax=Pseudoduganella lurida TaxID=1036180 RepID=A0A562RCM1_9BURK|nr:hypothetical protein [Pseudoduganella lurida]TWI66176.1 hypothetical protein IP91_01987 [Pseudoduganella lurida]
MTPEAASTIIEQLALGIDPRTGAALPGGDACTAPEIIRALFVARQALLGRVPGETAGARRGPVIRNGVVLANVGKRWSAEDGDTLMELFAAGTPIRDIGMRLGRTDSGIISRLVLAGALPDRDTGYGLLRGARESSQQLA